MASGSGLGPVLISASRRTDIPRFFAEWFRQRRAAGFVEFENVFRIRGRASLGPCDVAGYLFWTRDARPLGGELRKLRAEQVPYAFQFTITGYGSDLEPNRVPMEEAIASFREVAADLPGPGAIEWRYDPIVLSSAYPLAFHLETFERIAAELEGSTRVVNTSIVEPYPKAIRRIGDLTVLFRPPAHGRHAAGLRRAPEVGHVGPDGFELGQQLERLGRAHGMAVKACADASLGLQPSRCCGPELFAPYGDRLAAWLRSTRAAPSRPGCRCWRAVDIGMNETCLGGCRYCYVVSSDERVREEAAQHDPSAAPLRGAAAGALDRPGLGKT